MGDFVAPCFLLLGRAAEPFERLVKKGFDVVRLQATGVGAFHVFADASNLAQVHGVGNQHPLVQKRLKMVAVEGGIENGGEVGLYLGLFAVTDSLDQQLAQRLAFELELAENVEHLAAQRLARLLKFFQQLAVDIAFTGFLCHQIPQVAHLGLADTMDATEALFQAVRVPRQVVVDHQVRALQVDALAGGVGSQQHLHFRVVPEGFLYR